jgi:hypothetical protein
MLELWYYAPSLIPDIHEAVTSVLTQVKVRHGITHELIAVRTSKGPYGDSLIAEEEQQCELFERDFRPRTRILHARTGFTARDAFRSNRPRGPYYIAGTVAVHSVAGIEWHARRSRFAPFGQDPNLGFLKTLLESGPALLEQLCHPVENTGPEHALVEAFIASGFIAGNVRREVRLGCQLSKNEFGTFDWRKAADIVIESFDIDWVIEAKVRLTAQAFGQALLYSDLYARENPHRAVRRGIVCAETDEDIVPVCVQHDIAVFLVKDGAVRLIGSPHL